jgi:hypothetical protein
MISGGIFGPKLSGKSTLAKHLSRAYWTRKHIRSLVFDPHREQWGPQAWVTENEDMFWEGVWQVNGALVICEEAAATIRRDRDLIPVFTRLRHNRHRLLVIGHDGTDLLPVMRRQFDTIHLFLQPEEAIKLWLKDLPSISGLEQASQLRQYEFLRGQLFCRSVKLRLRLPRVTAVPH